MTAVATTSIWDFTPVLSLIHSFAAADSDVAPKDREHEGQGQEEAKQPPKEPSLGDFGNVLNSIGYLNDAQSSDIPIKRVHWEDEACEAALVGDHDRAEALIENSTSTKKQRKAARRRVGRVVLQKQSLSTPKRDLNSSSDDDRTFNNSSQGHLSITPSPRRSARLAKKATNSGPQAGSGGEDEEFGTLKVPDRRALIHELLDRPLPQTPERNGSFNILRRPESEDEKKWPTAEPVTTFKKAQEIAAQAVAAANSSKVIGILKKKFLEESPYLYEIPMLSIESSSTADLSKGLHVFIDASNILIGFHDALKVARSLPRTKRIQRQQMSFELLSLILSRGRPLAKAIVAGSDNCPEMVEAKLLGYEINILDRVHKAKELTPRQKRYANRENGGGTTSAGSGSETMAAAAAVAQFAPEKWVEQGVDEIIHLKMMESLVDATEPSTMVLATGDAAEAEFSGGFMRMVERALAKGWKVELACWKHNMSAAYRSHEFRQLWGTRFRVIELDEFVELIRVGP